MGVPGSFALRAGSMRGWWKGGLHGGGSPSLTWALRGCERLSFPLRGMAHEEQRERRLGCAVPWHSTWPKPTAASLQTSALSLTPDRCHDPQIPGDPESAHHRGPNLPVCLFPERTGVGLKLGGENAARFVGRGPGSQRGAGPSPQARPPLDHVCTDVTFASASEALDLVRSLLLK